MAFRGLLSLILLLPLSIAFSGSGWTRQSPSPLDTPVFLQVALASSNDDKFLQRVEDIGTPGSPYYRQHLSSEELAAWAKPDDESVSAVQSWLSQHGIRTTLNIDVLEANTTTFQLEQALRTKYHAYTHDSQPDEEYHRVMQYTLPEHIKKHVDLITPTTRFPDTKGEINLKSLAQRDKPLRANPEAVVHGSDGQKPNSTCEYLGPECLRQIYNVTYQGRPNSEVTQGIFAVNFKYNPKDIQKFLEIFNKPAANANASLQYIPYTGGHPTVTPDETIEAQTALALAWPLKGVYYDIPLLLDTFGTYFNAYHTAPKKTKKQEDFYFKFLHQLAFNKTVPSTLATRQTSIEYFNRKAIAGPEGPRENSRLCKAFAQVTARGVTNFFSTTQLGAYVVPVMDLTGMPVGNDTRLVANAQFPGTCPFITNVGTTKVLNPGNDSSEVNEEAWSESGGGISIAYNRPSWQNGHVDTYIRDHIPKSISDLYLYNPKGRGVPDISATGVSMPIVFQGKLSRFSEGTASLGIINALFALLNDYEVSKGRPLLGNINPWLYQQSGKGIVRDIATGPSNFNSQACFGNKACLAKKAGFTPVKGWDPVTGLGVPNFGKMQQNLDEMAKLLSPRS